MPINPASFHEVRFPTAIAHGARGGPERRTDIVVLGSGKEERNARWAHSRRRYNAGYGVKTLAALNEVVAFFEERRGRLFGFRWKDRMDFKSCALTGTPAATDQVLGNGDGVSARFQLVKHYGGSNAYARRIAKPVAATLLVAVDGAVQTSASFSLDIASGEIVFEPGSVPPAGVPVSAGFEFDVPVRFETDYLEINLSAFDAGDIPNIPLVEIVP